MYDLLVLPPGMPLGGRGSAIGGRPLNREGSLSMGRHKRSLVVVGLVLLAAALAPAAGARKPHKKKKPEPKPLSFRVTWTVTRGTWNMDYDCHCDHASYGGVHTLKEHDLGLRFEATYNDVKISAKDMTPAITADASSWSAKGDFSMNENVWTETDPDYLIDCNGKVAKGGPAPGALSRQRLAGQPLHGRGYENVQARRRNR